MGLKMNITFLTKDQKKQLLSRLAKVLAHELREVKETQKLTFKEISSSTAIPQNRLSEIMQHGTMSEKTLSGIIGGNVVKVSELLKKVGPLTQNEKTYLDSYYLYEDKELMGLLLKYREQKLDPKKVLKNGLKK